MKIKAGSILTLETGEYSDFTYHGPFKVLKDINQRQVVELFRAQWKPTLDPGEELGAWDNHPDPYEFMWWLTKEGYIEDIASHHSWHIGSYGRLEP